MIRLGLLAVCLAVVIECISADEAWNISYSNGTLQARFDRIVAGVATTSGSAQNTTSPGHVPSSVSLSSSLCGDLQGEPLQLQWYANATAISRLNISDLPFTSSQFPNSELFARLGSAVYSVSALNTTAPFTVFDISVPMWQPYRVYVIMVNSSVRMYCYPVAPATVVLPTSDGIQDVISCVDVGSTANVTIAIYPRTDDAKSDILITRSGGTALTNTTADVQFCQGILTLALARAEYFARFQSEGKFLRWTNDQRHVRARRVTAFIYWFITVMTIFTINIMCICIAAIWRPWTNLLNKIELIRKWNVNEIKLNYIAFSVLLMSLFIIGSTAGGFPGWTVITMLVVIATAVLALYFNIHACVYRRKRRKVSRRTPEEDEEASAVSSILSHPPPPQRWTEHPDALGTTQWQLVWVFLICTAYSLVILAFIWLNWDPVDYVIWDRERQGWSIELQDDMTEKTLQVLYAWDRLATNLRLQAYTTFFTSWCGGEFSKILSDSGKRVQILDKFITPLEIDMSPFERPSYLSYTSVNDWFTRTLNTTSMSEHHPLAVGPFSPTPSMDEDPIVVSPADARTLIFNYTSSATKYWIKGGGFTIGAMLGDHQLARDFEGGTVLISRLAPQDYHRFHVPYGVSLISDPVTRGDTYWSVAADAVQSRNNAFLNVRKISMFNVLGKDGQPDARKGKIAYVAVGATCVGSILLTIPSPTHNNTVYDKADEFGTFKFGGSTVVALFEPGKFIGDPDIQIHSNMRSETFVKMGQRIGRWAA